MKRLNKRQQDLVTSYINMIPGLVRIMMSKLYGIHNLIDLESDAQLGLVKAAMLFDKTKKCSFLTYAHRKIDFEMMNGARSRDFVPRSQRKRFKDDFSCDIRELRLIDNEVLLLCSNEHCPDYYIEIQDELGFLLSLLEDKKHEVVEKYYYKEKTLKEIGEEEGRTEGAVCTDIKKSLDKIRSYRKVSKNFNRKVSIADHKKRCNFPNCNNVSKTMGVCKKHYEWRNGAKEEKLIYSKYARSGHLTHYNSV